MREAKGNEEKLTIAGRKVSYIFAPNGAMRSYYVVDGDYHLVTTVAAARRVVSGHGRWQARVAGGFGRVSLYAGSHADSTR